MENCCIEEVNCKRTRHKKERQKKKYNKTIRTREAKKKKEIVTRTNDNGDNTDDEEVRNRGTVQLKHTVGQFKQFTSRLLYIYISVLLFRFLLLFRFIFDTYVYDMCSYVLPIRNHMQ